MVLGLLAPRTEVLGWFLGVGCVKGIQSLVERTIFQLYNICNISIILYYNCNKLQILLKKTALPSFLYCFVEFLPSRQQDYTQKRWKTGKNRNWLLVYLFHDNFQPEITLSLRFFFTKIAIFCSCDRRLLIYCILNGWKILISTSA